MDHNLREHQILAPTGSLYDLLQVEIQIEDNFDKDALVSSVVTPLLKDISILLSIKRDNIVLVDRDGRINFDSERLTYDLTKARVLILPDPQQAQQRYGEAYFCLQEYGANQLQPLHIRCSQHKSITFNYTAESTIIDLKEHIENEYKIPKHMQMIYREGRSQENDARNIIDILMEDSDQLLYEFSFAVRLPNGSNQEQQEIRDEISKICIENEFTILKSITIKFVNGETFGVIDITTGKRIYALYGVEDYIIENLYGGHLLLYHEYSKEFITEEKMREHVETFFLDNQSKSFFRENFNLIFVPDYDHKRYKDVMLSDFHKVNLTQQIRLIFVSKEEIVTENRRISVKDLKDKIKVEFGYAPYQQKLFCDKRQLDDGELLTELYMEQEGDFAIKVCVSKANSVDVRVTCLFQNQHDEPLQFTLNNVEDNLFVKDLRKMVQDQLQHQGPVALKDEAKQDEQHHLEDNSMICDLSKMHFDGKTSDNVVGITIHKFFIISFREKYKRYHTKTKPDDEVYIIEDTSETVQIMLRKFNRRELKRYKIHSKMMNNLSVNGKKIDKHTLLVSLDSGTVVHLKEKKPKDDDGLVRGILFNLSFWCTCSKRPMH